MRMQENFKCIFTPGDTLLITKRSGIISFEIKLENPHTINKVAIREKDLHLKFINKCSKCGQVIKK